MKKSKGQLLFEDFLAKLEVSMRKAREQNVITLDDLQPTWEARDRLEKFLTPPRNEKGYFLPSKPPQGVEE